MEDKMNLSLKLKHEMERFVSMNGIKPYDKCFCGSNKQFKWCCRGTKTSMSDNEVKSFQANLHKEIWSNEDGVGTICMYNGCNNNAIRSHTIQRHGALSIIEPDEQKDILRVIRRFINGKDAANIQLEKKKHATIFWGFCNNGSTSHDKSIFKIVESKSIPITFTNEQRYAFAYRCLSYESNFLKRIIEFNINNYLKPNSWRISNDIPKHSNKIFEKSIDIFDYRAKYIRLNNNENIRLDTEKNYNDNTKQWTINNDILEFGNIYTVNIKQPSLVFYNVTILNEDSSKSHNRLNLQCVKEEKYNFIITLAIPTQTNNLNYFFGYSKFAGAHIKSFIQNMTNKNSKNVLNNLIINNNEQFYFNEDYWNNNLSKDEKNLYKNYINKKAESYIEVLDCRNIFDEPLINFIK